MTQQLSRKEAGRGGALDVEVGGESEASLGWDWRFSTSLVDFLDFVFIYPFCHLWDRILLCSLSGRPASAPPGVQRLQTYTKHSARLPLEHAHTEFRV